MAHRASRAKQLDLVPRRRKPGPKAIHDVSIRHRPRETFAARYPLHISVRVEKRVCNLRAKTPFRVVKKALQAAGAIANARICEYSVQGNHMHLLVEAGDRAQLSSAMRSLNIRIGRNLNRVMQSRGRVIAHRYHCRVLRTPTEVRHARHYVRKNNHHHAGGNQNLPDVFSSAVDRMLPTPHTWLLERGWRRGRSSLLDPFPLSG